MVNHFPHQWKIRLYTQLPCSRDGTSWRAPWRCQTAAVKCIPSRLRFFVAIENCQHTSARVHKLTPELGTHEQNQRPRNCSWNQHGHSTSCPVAQPVRRRFLHIMSLFHEVLAARAASQLPHPITSNPGHSRPIQLPSHASRPFEPQRVRNRSMNSVWSDQQVCAPRDFHHEKSLHLGSHWRTLVRNLHMNVCV